MEEDSTEADEDSEDADDDGCDAERSGWTEIDEEEDDGEFDEGDGAVEKYVCDKVVLFLIKRRSFLEARKYVDVDVGVLTRSISATRPGCIMTCIKCLPKPS